MVILYNKKGKWKMFDYIKGILAHKQSTNGCCATIESGGIGYLLNITEKEAGMLPNTGDNIKIFTILIHKEDSMTLYGFLSRENRDIFKILTSVSGVGPKMALLLLDEFDSYELISLVIKGDYKELTRAKGIGPKLAQKIILELKDKLMNFQNSSPITLSSKNEMQDSPAIQEAGSVLISLGYEREEIKSAMLKALSATPELQKPEEILKETLKILSSI